MRRWQSSVDDPSKNLAPIAVTVVPGSLPNEQLELLFHRVGLKGSCSTLELAPGLVCIPLQVEHLPNLPLNLIKEFGVRARHHSQTLLQFSCEQRRALCSIDGDTHRAWELLKEQPSRVTRAKHEIAHGNRLRRTQLRGELGVGIQP